MNTDNGAAIERLEALYPAVKAELLESLYSQCADEFCAICNREDVPARAGSVIEQMTAYRISQLNAEGLASQNFSGMSEAFLTDYPERLKRAMYRFRRLSAR